MNAPLNLRVLYAMELVNYVEVFLYEETDITPEYQDSNFLIVFYKSNLTLCSLVCFDVP